MDTIRDSEHAGAIRLRDELRAIMRGEDSRNALAIDLIREVTEWHDAGRPDITRTREMLTGRRIVHIGEVLP